MECIRRYDIELEKEVYYGGETLKGCVVIENAENLRVNSVQVFLRGKAHVEWRVTRAGERRTVKEDQFFVDEKTLVWGRETGNGGSGVHHWETTVAGNDASSCENNLSPSGLSVMSSGEHRFPFNFQLPEGRLLPGSFESRHGAVRYYVRVLIDVPYASPLQGLKYFTVVGPLIDRLDSRYNTPLTGRQQTTEKSCLCCTSGHVVLEVLLERGSYCCGERIRVKCDIQNASSCSVTLVCRLIQTVEYRINKGTSGLVKVVTHQALEWFGPTIHRQSTKIVADADNELRVPVMPPTTTGICDPINISYAFQVCLTSEKPGGDMQVEFPIVIVTVPHRTLNSQTAELVYEPAAGHVEGGIYVSPEFLLGQVYDGAILDSANEVTILYRPVYVCVQTPDNSITQATPSSGVRSTDIQGSSSAVPDVELSTTSSRSISLADERRPDNDESIEQFVHVNGASDGGSGFRQSQSSSPRSSKALMSENCVTTSLPQQQQQHTQPPSSPSKLSKCLLVAPGDIDESASSRGAMTFSEKDDRVASMCMTVTGKDAIPTTAELELVQDHRDQVIIEQQLGICDIIIEKASSEFTIDDEQTGTCRLKRIEQSTKHGSTDNCVALTAEK